MSSQPIRSYEPQRLNTAVAPAEETADPSTQGIGLALARMRRRWRLMLGLWCSLAALGLIAVLARERITYTATALIEVAPVVPAILDDRNDPIPQFDAYLNTQSQVVGSLPVITAALADPLVQDLPLLRTTDPLPGLRRSLSVGAMFGTHLIEVKVNQADPDSALRLTQALLSAYMAQAVGEDQEQQRATRQLLEKAGERLRATLDQQSSEIRRLAEAYGTSSEAVFGILRESLEKYSLETRQELERADLEIFQLEQQIERLNSGLATTSQPEEWYALRQQAIESDPGVRLMRKDVEDAMGKEARLRLTLGSAHQATQAARQNMEQLRGRLQEEREQAAVDVDKELASRQKEQLEETLARLQDSLAVARHRREVLQERVDKRNLEGMRIGRQGIEIQGLREQRELTKQDYERVIERLKRLEIESQRPTRISIASAPEIRPDGISDKRLKKAVLALMGSLIVTALLVLVRDGLDRSLQNVQQVEDDVGLRLLGAVPSVADLQTGRIEKSHYLESFRVIRANLAGAMASERPSHSILITSAQASEGKTSLAISLAISLTESNHRVLLIDGDTQVPQIGRLLKITPSGDLKGVLLGTHSLQESVAESGIPGLHVLIGRANGQTARSSLTLQSAGELISRAAACYDFVVIDSPPVLGAADSLFWAHAADGVILTSLVGHSDRRAIRLACQRLTSMGGRLLGSVIANVSRSEAYYSYSASSVSQDRPHGKHAAKRVPPLVYLTGETPEEPTKQD